MREKYKQMPLPGAYKSIKERLENKKPERFLPLDEHPDWEEIIPVRFYSAFYRRLRRKRGEDKDEICYIWYLLHR